MQKIHVKRKNVSHCQSVKPETKSTLKIPSKNFKSVLYAGGTTRRRQNSKCGDQFVLTTQ